MGPGFRVLDAGCGTGDNAIFLAEQLRGTGATVTGIDLSAHSLDIASARAKARGSTSTSGRRASKRRPAWGLGSSTTSSPRACCTTCRTRARVCGRCAGCSRRAAGSG
ncbi:MAG: class I SAM-dependent methyltransferase [Thermoflexaceae bacterium]|nr:class I SAM-dependent methyltransferase [Thermoflexaceae bacterium]